MHPLSHQETTEPQLGGIYVYPIKSTAGLPLERARVTHEGLLNDRRYMVVKPDGTFVTARTHPRLQLLAATPIDGGLRLEFPGQNALVLQEKDFSLAPQTTTVWRDTFNALHTHALADAWMSRIAGESVRLLWLGEQSQRYRETAGTRVSFADGYPLLLISQASLDDLNLRSDALHQMSQFRTNLVAMGTRPFEEDSWKRIRIGDVEFAVANPCSRCIMTTVEAGTDRFNVLREPLSTLARYRRGEDGEVYFGQNLVALNEGWIDVGSPIEVLETAVPVVYPDTAPKKLRLVCVGREPLSQDMETFWLESADGSALPSYLPGQHVPLAVDLEGQRVQRRYTLTSSPDFPARYSISVKHQADGRISSWLHQSLQVGTTLLASHPTGNFHLGEKRHLLLLSAGSGVTPMLAIVRTLASRGELSAVHFMHVCRTEEDIPALRELGSLVEQGMQLTVILSQPRMDWKGLSGRLNNAHLALVQGLSEREVFICGPQGFMAHAVDMLAALGVPASQMKQESFGGIPSKHARPHKTVRLQLGTQHFVGNNQDNILDQAHKQGIVLPWSCRAGVCGACKQQLHSGEVDQPEVAALSAQERAQGTILACCAVPLTDVVIGAL
jgi:uncharacterized protein